MASHGGRQALCYRAILHAYSIVQEVVTAVGTACMRGFAGLQLSVLQPHVVGLTISCIFNALVRSRANILTQASHYTKDAFEPHNNQSATFKR